MTGEVLRIDSLKQIEDWVSQWRKGLVSMA